MIEVHIDPGSAERERRHRAPELMTDGHGRQSIEREPTDVGGLERMGLQRAAGGAASTSSKRSRS
mgnify:CR=1 FL=1